LMLAIVIGHHLSISAREHLLPPGRPSLLLPKIPSEQAIEPERIADAENIGGRVAVEADRNVEIDLLCVGDAIAAAGIEEVTRATMHVIVADVFDEQESACRSRAR
jgi:hypothetical protein